MKLLCAALIISSPIFAGEAADWERGFDENAHVYKRGRAVLVEPGERNLKDVEKRILGHWRHVEEDQGMPHQLRTRLIYQDDRKIKKVRDAYFGPVNKETGRGEFYAVDSDEKGRNEMALIYSIDLDKSTDKRLFVRFYSDRDSPVPLFREIMDLPTHGKHMIRAGLRDATDKTTWDYLDSNDRPGSKMPKGWVLKPLIPDGADGLHKNLVEAGGRLTTANNELRRINENYIESRWRPEQRDKIARHLKRFTEGELKRSRSGFKVACREYVKVYGKPKAKKILSENGLDGLIE